MKINVAKLSNEFFKLLESLNEEQVYYGYGGVVGTDVVVN